MSLDPSVHDTRRRRSSLACNTCRARRTKCDGQRPKCSFCVERSKDCFYQGTQSPPPSPLKMELSRIWEQLEHMTGVVQGRSSPSEDVPFVEGLHHDTSLGFPFMTVQNTAFMDLLGLDPSLPVLLEKMERGRQTNRSDIRFTFSLLNAFAEQIHIWYPILHADYTDEFLQAIASFFPHSTASCLTLLVLAIGCLVECESIVHALQRRPETIYIQAAMEMLPCVLTDSSPRSAQCLLLFSIYHLCYAQPCQAHDYVVMASYKLQNSLLNDFDTEENPIQMAIIGNCFWSALLIESEIAVQLDLVDSGIWNMSSLAPAPASLGTWTWILDRSNLFATPDSAGSDEAMHSCGLTTDLSYFMAEIAMRKMLQHCTWSIRTVSQNTHAYAPIVATELERQLDEWHRLLPQGLAFGRPDHLTSSQPPAQVEFLRTQYYAYKASVYWPAAYEAISAGDATEDLLLHCRRFFDAYTDFVTSAAVSVHVCRPNVWTLYTSVFTISMAAVAALAEPCLFGVVPPSIVQSLELAVGMFGRVTETSPSLAKMGAILKERALQAVAPLP
ncbi:hypothetical protein BDW59DRAFT_175766 [Aspergillus cavernicola]|uniref:Zn(2)-C6 fungal-type domain-containing protein n=1 Tax=Aspergillus cavernicola TaxID=176166 RepID=A0ABR4HM87_9EURO